MAKKPNIFQRLFRRNYNVDPVQRVIAPFNPYDFGISRDQARNINDDFGYPNRIEFLQFHNMYSRNALAFAAIQKIVKKCYQSYPTLKQSEDSDDETPQEQLIRQHFAKIRFWQNFIEADRRGMVGGYAGLILRIADGKKFNEPVESLAGAGVESIVEVIPAWRGQLRVSKYINEIDDPDYGKPAAYQYNEAEMIENQATETQPRSFEVHPDRVLIMSRDGTIHADSLLLPGYNALLDVEKIIGAGGEGFWRNARAAPIISVDKEIQHAEILQAFGAKNSDELQSKLDDRVKGLLKGFKNYLMLKGITVTYPNVALPSPEHYFKNSVEFFASSVDIPFKILIGNVTGERSSTEDNKEWAQTCMSRREEVIIPIIEQLIFRLQEWNAIDTADWSVDWKDLTDASAEEKRNTAEKMTAMNTQSVNSLGELVFTTEEIRAIMGYEPLSDEEKIVDTFDDDDDELNQAIGDRNA